MRASGAQNGMTVKKSSHVVTTVMGVFFILAVAELIFLLSHYVGAGAYLDHIEPNQALAGWTILHGGQVYVDHALWPVFSTYYGPISYLVQAISFAFLGGTIPASNIANGVFITIGFGLFTLYAWRLYGLRLAFVAGTFYIGFIGLFVPFSIWNRPDPLTVFVVTVALVGNGVLGTQAKQKLMAYLLLGVCMGVAINLKVHSFIYFAPIVFYRCGFFRDIGGLVIISVAAAGTFSLPFLMSEVSLAAYSDALVNMVTSRPISMELLQLGLRKSILFLSPVFVLAVVAIRNRQAVQAADVQYFLVLAITVAVALYPSSFPGAGPYHMLPLFPITIDAALRFARSSATSPKSSWVVVAVLAVTVLALSLPNQRRLLRNLDRAAVEQQQVEADISSVLNRYKGESVHMGYGESFETYRLSYYKPLLAFAGHPMVLDAQVIMELRFAGPDLTEKLTPIFSDCRVRHWLVPKGEAPFALKSYYDGQLMLFGDAVDVFRTHYIKTDTLSVFDVWSCRP